MLRRLKLQTKLAFLIAIAIAATLAVGIPGIDARVRTWQGTALGIDHARAAGSLGDLARHLEREATLSAWFGASGEPAAHAALAVERPLTDQSAREVARSRPIFAVADPTTAKAIDRIEARWSAIRTGRAKLDRRLASDAATLIAFDRATAEVVRALDAAAASETGRGHQELATDFRARADTAGLERAIGLEQATLITAVARDRVTATLGQRLQTSAAEQAIRRAPATAAARLRADSSLRAALTDLRSSAATVANLRAPALSGAVPKLTPVIWQRASDRQLDALHAIGHTLDASAVTRAISDRGATRDSLVRYAATVAAILLGALILGLLLSRAIRRPIRAVATAAARLAQRQQENAVSADGPRDAAPAASIAVRTRDEIGDLARAVHDIDLATVEAASTQRRTQRNDIGDLYVTLARRNQPLLGRQLDLIDELEASEHDPDRLSSLFQLDHLATRMRRNAESLLVLAGMEDLRTHTAPVPILDVVRGAISEIEDFERVDVVGLPPDIEVIGRVAIDLTHVLAELIENAATYSPRESRVFIGARRRPTGLELTISDEGIGVPVDRLDALNEILAHPPLPGFDISRSLGLVVVARLNERIGGGVVLRSAAEVGTSAVVNLPSALLVTRDRQPALVTAPDAWVGEAPTSPPIAAVTKVELEVELPVAPVEPAIEVEPVVVSADEVEPTQRDVRFTPVPLERDQDLLPAPLGRHARYRRRRNGRVMSNEFLAAPPDSPSAATSPAAVLPRRTPVSADPDRLTEPSTPAPRAPTAVFELVARYEAGRRRADPPVDATTHAIDSGDEGKSS